MNTFINNTSNDKKITYSQTTSVKTLMLSARKALRAAVKTQFSTNLWVDFGKKANIYISEFGNAKLQAAARKQAFTSTVDECNVNPAIVSNAIWASKIQAELELHGMVTDRRDLTKIAWSRLRPKISHIKGLLYGSKTTSKNVELAYQYVEDLVTLTYAEFTEVYKSTDKPGLSALEKAEKAYMALDVKNRETFMVDIAETIPTEVLHTLVSYLGDIITQRKTTIEAVSEVSELPEGEEQQLQNNDADKSVAEVA